MGRITPEVSRTRGVDWGVSEADRALAWSSRPLNSTSDGERSTWGVARGNQAIVAPQVVSWAANHPRAAHDAISEAIVGSVPKSLKFVQNLAVFNPNRLGATTFPVNYKAPQFSFNTLSKKTKGGKVNWFAKPKLTQKADEGDSRAFHIGPGLHKTTHKEVIKAGKGAKVAPVYWNMSKAMSARDRDAENEHSNDHKQAYKISLKEAQTVLKTAVVGKHFGPKPTKAAVKQSVLNMITKSLTHAKLGNDQSKWAAKYKALTRRTLIRDNKGWHSFGLGNRKVKGGKVIYDIQKGTTKINVVKSKTIIKY